MPPPGTRAPPGGPASAWPPAVRAPPTCSPGSWTRHMDSTPMVILCGQVDSRLIGKDAFQETDVHVDHRLGHQARLPAAPCRRSRGHLPRRLSHRRHGPPGTGVHRLPKDVLMATTAAALAAAAAPARLSQPNRSRSGRHRRRGRPAPAGRATAAPARRRGARSPTPARLFCALAERLDLPVVSTINAKGVIPESHPSAHGMIGMYGRKSGVWALMNARPPARLRLPLHRPHHRRRRALRGRQEASSTSTSTPTSSARTSPSALAIQADARAAAQALLRATARHDAEPEPQRRWARQARAARDDLRALRSPYGSQLASIPSWSWTSSTACAARTTSSPPASASTRCSPAISSSTIGRAPSSAPAEPGTMGYGLPAAIGAAFGPAGRRGVRRRRRRQLSDDRRRSWRPSRRRG